jgi:hypothetical protein
LRCFNNPSGNNISYRIIAVNQFEDAKGGFIGRRLPSFRRTKLADSRRVPLEPKSDRLFISRHGFLSAQVAVIVETSIN